MRRVLLACDLDSQVFGALPLALAFAARGWEVTFAIESIRSLPQQVLERLTRDFGIIERPISALPADDEIFRHNAVGVFVTGSRLALFRHLLDLSSKVQRRPRPALFCGFNGLVFEKFEEGLAWRLGYDVIGLNGPRDRDAFVDFLHATEFSRQPSVIVGLRRKTDTPPRPLKTPQAAAVAADQAPPTAPLDEEPEPARLEAATVEGGGDESAAHALVPIGVSDVAPAAAPAPVALDETPPGQAQLPAVRKLFVFAEQVVVPRSLRERQNLVAILARLAETSPNWDVVIKARVRPDEQTFHQQPNHISKLVKEVRRRPSNLSVSYEPLDGLLDRADLFATVSSTALFDAFDFGVPSMVATDFGLRNADGAHVFFASGLLVQLSGLASLDDAPIRSPDERWMRRMGYGAPFSPGALIDWLETFNPARPMPAAFVSHQAAANVAAGNSGYALKINQGWNAVEKSLAERAENEDDGAASARAALFKLASVITEALSPVAIAERKAKDGQRDARKETPPPAPRKADGAPGGLAAAKVVAKAVQRREGPIAAGSRKIGMYWFYKRVRARLGIPVR